jgi:hypothetical protein
MHAHIEVDTHLPVSKATATWEKWRKEVNPILIFDELKESKCCAAHTVLWSERGHNSLFKCSTCTDSLSLCCLELLLLWRYVMEEKRLNAGCRCTHLTRLPRFGFLHKLTCSNSLVTINASRGISTTNSEGICSSLRGCFFFFFSFDCFLNQFLFVKILK